MEVNFSGKRVLVTGAGQGIGRETAKKLAESGAKVIALSRTGENLNSLVAEYPDIDGRCVDLADWEETRKCVQSLGDVDMLVNNAAVALLEPFLSIEPENIDRSFEVNVKAVINVSQIIAQGMIRRKTGGSIVNISSQASQAALQDHAVYCATKGALDMLSKVMALELGPHKSMINGFGENATSPYKGMGVAACNKSFSMKKMHSIRVNCVNPTVVMTAMGKIGWSKPEKADPMLKKIPLGRFAEVHEVVNTILFLLSDKASMITGITLPVDGGFLAC